MTKLIVIAGVDGTGKTTLSHLLKENLIKRGIRVKLVRMRMNYFVSRPFLLICRLTGLTKRPIINGKKISVHEFYRFKPIAKLIQYTHFIDTFLHWMKKIYLPISFNKVVICDRFIHDILVDFAIEANEQDIFSKRIAKFFNLLIPKNSLFFFIDVDKENILKRRSDVVEYDKYFDQRYRIYKDLKKNKLFQIVDNNNSKESAFSHILQILK